MSTSPARRIVDDPPTEPDLRTTRSARAAPGRRVLPTPRPVPRPIGRPRSGTADRAILDAAMALLAEVGLSGLTVSAVVSRSRVARATVYRRYPTREALISAALAQVKGREPFTLGGDLATDIATGAVWAAAVLNETAFQRFLPLFVGETLRSPAAARNLIERVAPNHAEIAREYAALAAGAGLRTDIDPALVSDILLGAMLMRLLSSGVAPDARAAEQLVDVLLRGLAEVDPATASAAPVGPARAEARGHG